MKRKWNRLLALCLCALMLCSDLSGLVPRAQADPAPATPTLVSNTGVQDDFQNSDNGRPNLFVDFLGDNNNFIYDPNGTGVGVNGAGGALATLDPSSLDTISVPAPYNQSKSTNPTGPGNTWLYYMESPDCAAGARDNTIFWVGLGVDRVELLKLLEDGNGLTSLEAGFYYDSKVIEPYVDPTFLPPGTTLSTATDEELQAAYQQTIAKANIANPNYPDNTQWSSDYTICRALTGLEPETDPVTREELDTPTIDDILENKLSTTNGGQTAWKMTYVSLELTDIGDTTPASRRRLAGLYKGVDGLETGVTADGETAPITPASAAGDQYVVDGDNTSGYDYNYILLIPFRLKNFGSMYWTSLRLVRDATHFSIGAGSWGVDAYGAWERTTTRNGAVAASAGDSGTLSVEGHPDRDLKLLTRFAGDLKLFSAGRVSEVDYDALLHIIGDGGSLNRAKLTVDGDPAVWPVWADADGEIIGGLQSGQGMYLEVHTQENYVATVTVTYSSGGGTVYHAYTQVLDGAQDDAYRFVMPSFDVTVTVTFTYVSGDNALIYLSEEPQPGGTGYAVGNETTIQTSLDASYAATSDTKTINSFSSVSAHPNYSHPGLSHPSTTPVATAKKDGYVQIDVATHSDYVAVVRIYDFRAQEFMTSGLTITATGATGVTPVTATTIPNPAYTAGGTDPATIPNPDYGKITLPQGGQIRLRMGSQDLDVEVTYEKGQRYQATLEVYNPTGTTATDFDLNTAQLVYDLYDSLDLPSKAYSSVVYHDYDPGVTNDHRAIHPTKGAEQLPWVSTSQASLSGSLGGDTGRTGKTWNPKDLPTSEDVVTGGRTIMALLAGSATEADLQTALNGLDFATTPVDDGSATGLTGLRKNAAGELYGDADVSAPLGADVDEPTIIDALWELREYIDADTTTGGLKDTYLKTVTKADSSVAYTYYDLTSAQLQAYLLEISAVREINAKNDLAYRLAYRRYLKILSEYNRLSAIPAYSGMAALQAPAKNLSTTVTSGKREYQDIDYKDSYLAAYDSYLDAYEQYLIDLEANAGTSGDGAPTNIPSFTATIPAKKAITLKTASGAVSFLSTYVWDPATVPTEVPATGLTNGGTIETRAGRTVYIVLQADSAYELDTANTNVYPRGAAPDYNTGSPALTTPVGVTPSPVTGYQNVYSFVMPSEDCVVRVSYKLRGTRKLNIRYVGAAGLDDNEAIVEAYAVADPAAVTPELVTTTNKGYTSGTLPSGGSYDPTTDTYTADPVEKAFKGSVVTIRAKAADGYEIKSVEAKNSDSTTVTVSQRVADDPADGYIYTFTIAEGRDDDVTLTITYGPEKEEEYTATIRSSTEGAANSGNKATWYVGSGATATTPTVISAVKPATHLTGHVSVAPGYYIKSITAWGNSGSYPFTYTGNGYNNGYGTSLTGTDVPIDIYVDMPHEDLIVDVVFAKGTPDPAPGNTLTLIVKDDDNTETNPADAAPNYASAKVYDTKPADWTTTSSQQDLPAAADGVAGDVLGKNKEKGNGVLTSCKYAQTGQWVVVDFSAYVAYKADTSEGAASGATVIDPDKSYYVSSVTVGPDHLGVALIWEGLHTVSFYMPAGSTAVTVEFSKYPANGRLPDYPLTVRETYMDLNTGTSYAIDSLNYITTANSTTTIPRWNPSGPYGLSKTDNPEIVPPTTISTATGAATAGEEVTMTFQVDEGDGTAADPGWYVQSIVLVSNGAVTRLTGTQDPIASPAGTPSTVKTYEVKFRMPASPAEFIVHYRKGPAPTIPDYAFTLTIDDPDNVLNSSGLYDENSVLATFHDPTNAASSHADIEVGRNKGSVTAVQHIHSGDVVTLKTTLDSGYYLEYMIVNPAGLGISPVWSDANTASFVMPKEGVAVVARVVKGTAQQYTANLILRYEDENGNEILPSGKTIHDIGKGTFTLPTTGTLDSYATKAVYSTVQLPGTAIGYDLYAFDGYYIDRITVEPTRLGVTGSLSGSCGDQDGEFVMPHANVNVNVWFKAGWPDEIPYDLTIKVHDSSLKGTVTPNTTDNNYAALRTITGRTPAPTVDSGDLTPVYGGQTKVIDRAGYPLDRDVVILDVDAKSGFYVDSSSISITDSQGNSVSWWYVPGGIAFVQPPRAVTAEITFRNGAPVKQYTATLHLTGYVDTDTSADKNVINDYVLLAADSANTHAQTTTQASSVTAPPVAVDANGTKITDLYHGDTLDLSAMPGAKRHITAAYAVNATTGEVLPIYGYDTAGALTSARAQYVPGKPGTASTTTPAASAVAGTVTKGAFAMPESDVDVYVKYADGAVVLGDLTVDLVVSGPSGSGSATAVIDEADPKADQTMSVSAPGMDACFTTQGNEVVVTFEPNTGYGITALEVTGNATGEAVPYAWISVLQDPAVIDNSAQDNSNLWSGVAPAPGISHPTWTPNPQKQIKLNVPAGGVTIKVTYGPQDNTVYRAQVVVNDPLAGTASASTSKNNAWVSQQAGADADDATLKKLQEAKPGEWVDLNITVHPGYRIEFVKVIPQSFGIVPGLPIGTDMGGGITYYLHDQDTGFYMPSGDCTVYVKFARDDTATRSVTLVVDGAPTNPKNFATIESPLSGQKGPVMVQGTPQSVSARPSVDWVTSDYEWNTATSSIASITVVRAGDGSAVPFTQVEDPSTGQGQITFPMVNDDVVVTITYRADADPVGQEVVLHVIDKDRLTNPSAAPILGDANSDGAMDNYGLLSYTAPVGYPAGYASTATGEIAPGVPETTATIYVPAGQTVDVTACSDAAVAGLDGNGKVYIESAYVLFTQSGQMVNFNLTPDSLLGGTGSGYSGLHDESSFVVHPGRNDVYITLTRTEPKTDQHAAVLMLRSPSADTQSEAGIHADQTTAAWSNADPARRDKVRANDPNDTHAYVTATDGEEITISVEPASGFVIDYVQITPLGFPLDTDPVYHYTRTGNTITFDMPHCNVAVTVYLKRGSDQDHTATLRFLQDPNCPITNLPQLEDYAKLTWTPTGQTATSIWADAKPAGGGAPAGATQEWSDVSSMIVKEGSTVTLDVTLDTNPSTGDSDVILAAFVVRKDTGSIVTLTPSYPTGLTALTGIEGVTESASGAPSNDNALPDATATFTMPMGDVEVYVVVTTQPPTDPWHTVALIATDHSPTGNNSGLNEGDLWNNAAPTDVRVAKSDNVPTIAWVTVTETDTFSVLPRAAAGYRFDAPAVMTGNDGTTRNLSSLYANYLYEVTPVLCNQVVRIDFESSDDLELTVEIEDPDNPGDGTVEQVVTADPPGTTPPTLRLTSNSVAGSYQIISGVTPGDTVTLTAEPHDGYALYAQLHTIDSTVTNIPLTDGDGDGVWDGSFTMPANNARVVVTFYKPYTATLTLVNRISEDTTGQATMSEDKRGLVPLNVHSLNTSDSFDSLPNGTKLDAQVTSDLTGRRVTGLLTVNGSTTLLSATSSGTVGDPDHYYHTIDRADAEITLVLDDTTEHPNAYLAAVRAVNKPAGTAHPTIRAATAANQTEDPNHTWTTADAGDTVTVTLDVPYGYEATVDAGSVSLSYSSSPLDGPASSGGADKTHTATFTMPAADVQVTVTYTKVLFDLTLKIVDATGKSNATNLTADSAHHVSGGPTLTANGTMVVRANANIDLSATPATGAVSPSVDPHVAAVYYQTASGAVTWLQSTALLAGTPYTPTSPAFTMPAEDVTVTVVYDDHTADSENALYLATVEVIGPDGHPGNRAVSLLDIPDAGLPADSPRWVVSKAGSEIRVSYEAEAGYYVTVSARRADTGAAIPVLQMSSSGSGTGSVTMPSANIIITLRYSTSKPSQTNKVALQLIDHEAEAGNKAETSNFTNATQLLGLATTGVTTNHPPFVPAYTAATDPVETLDEAASLDDDLRTLANWADGYRVVRMTVAVRTVTRDGSNQVTAVSETPEVDLLVSRYASSATTRALTPVAGTDEEIVIRVYYGNIYNATFHLVGADPTDTHTATDVETGTTDPVGYTSAYDVSNNAISKPIQDNLDRIESYQGDGTEDIQTTAKAGTGRRLVGVVWESDLTGAQPTTSAVTDRYDFTMPADDVDFYAVYEPEPTDPKDKSYIAKVAFDASSVHQGDSRNQVSIRNASDGAASGGKYWTAAKGGDSVEVTVKVAPGYQAEILSTKIDNAAQLSKLPQINDGGALRDVQAGDPYHYYITRTQFVANLTAGKTATFTMPADTDATVTIRYTKGYDLTLTVADASLLDKTGFTTEENTVELTHDAADHLKWKNDAATADAAVTTDGAYDPDPAILADLPGDKQVATNVTVYDPDAVTVKVTRYTPFTGTVTLTEGSASPHYPFLMPYEDTIESVLLRDKNAADDLLAKVELAGDSDINGNGADPIVDDTTPAPATTTGAIWTTTDGGNVIDLTLSVAKGYVAKIKVRRDDSVNPSDPTDSSVWVYLDAADYQFQQVWTVSGGTSSTVTWSSGITEVQIGYNAAALPQQTFPDSVGGEQHFRFVMPETRAASGTAGAAGYDPGDTETDVTVIVTFEKVSDMPRPFDPRNVDEETDFDQIDHRPGFLEDGFIYGENRGDYAIIEIPTLEKDEGDAKKLYDTDNYDTASTPPTIHDSGKDPGKEVERYIFALYDASTDTYTELVEGTDVTLLPYDEDTLAQTGDLYNYLQGLWNGTETWHDTSATAAKRDFVGSKFLLLPKAKADGSYTTGGQALYDMLNNKGSLESYTGSGGATQYRTTLYVMAEDANKNQSDYTEVWIRPWFALGVKVVSYGPTHELTGELYRLMTQDELDVATGYKLSDGTVNPAPPAGVTGSTAVDAGNFQHYKWDEGDAPDFTDSEVVEEGSGKWLQILRVKSSELLGGFDSDYDPREQVSTPAQSSDRTLLDNVDPSENLTYALVLKKAANLPYTRVKLELNPSSYTGMEQLSDFYEDDKYTTRTFMLQDTVYLIAGDVDENGKTKIQDYDAVYDYVYRSKAWSEMQTEPVEPLKADGTPDTGTAAYTAYQSDLEDWAISIYNPKSLAYRCDLDGDRNLTVLDLNIVNTKFNYNRDETDYHWYQQSGSVWTAVLPFGLGARDNAYTALFALNAAAAGEIFPDAYWDETVDPAETLAIPMETIYIDAEGVYTLATGVPGQTEDSGEVPEPLPEEEDVYDERPEIPLGEEALEQRPIVE